MTKHFIRVLFLVLTFKASQSWCKEGFTTDASVLPDIARSTWDSVIRVQCTDPSGAFTKREFKNGATFGSAVLLQSAPGSNKVLAVTNSHVVMMSASESASGKPIRCPRLTFSFEKRGGGLTESSSFRLLYEENAVDLAFLEISTPRDATIVTAKLSTSLNPKQYASTEVWGIGFPDLSMRKIWHITGMSKPEGPKGLKRVSYGELKNLALDYPFRPANFISAPRSPQDVFIHSSDTLPGSSGGALVNRSGEVLGVVSSIEYVEPYKSKFEYCFDKPGVPCWALTIPYHTIRARALHHLGIHL